MRALVARRPGEVSLEIVPDPVAGAGEVVVHPVASGLCGTDIELVDGTIDPAYVVYPLVLGHEWVGRDTAGNLVVVEGIVACGVCEECRRGATNRCVTYDEIGFTRPGALADAISVPAHLVHVLAPDVDLLDAVLVEPMAVVWRALRRAAPAPGARCLVVGDGTVALLAVTLLSRFAPARVDVLGLRPAQAGLARSAGADRFLTSAGAERYDLVVEAAGQRAAVEVALGAVARGGTVVLLGLPAHGTRVDLAPDDLVNDDLTIQGSFSYTRDAWREIVDLVNDGLVHPSFLVTHRFLLADWSDALAALRAVPSDQPRGKVLISVDPAT